MHFAALEINLRHFETPLENKHRGVKHVSIDFAGVHTATREIIGVGIGSVGFFNFMTVDMMGPAGVGATAYARSFSSWFFLVSTWQTKKPHQPFIADCLRSTLLFSWSTHGYRHLGTRYISMWQKQKGTHEFHAVWLPDNIDQLLGTAWMLAWKYAHFTIRWIGSKGI